METVKNQPIIKISPVTDLLIRAWGVFKGNFWRFIGMMLIPILGVLPLAAVFILNGVLTFLGGDNLLVMFLKYVLVLAGIGSIVFLIAMAIIAQVGLFILIKNNAERISVKSAFFEAKKIAWKFFVLNLITGLLVFLWTFLLIIPGLIAIVNYSFALWMLVCEGKSGTGAVKASRELVRGYWWAVAGRLLCLQLLIFAVIITPIIFIKNDSFLLVWGIISQVISILSTPLSLAYSYFMYQGLKKIKNL